MAEFKGFMNSNDNAASDTTNNKYYEYGVAAYNAHRYAQAFYCFSKQKDDCLESKFNMALIYWKSGLIEKSLDELMKANKMIATGTTNSIRVDKAIEEKDANGEGYKEVMLKDEAILFPQLCRIRLLRVQVDLLYELNRIDDIKKIIPELTGKGYKNIERIANAIV